MPLVSTTFYFDVSVTTDPVSNATTTRMSTDRYSSSNMGLSEYSTLYCNDSTSFTAAGNTKDNIVPGMANISCQCTNTCQNDFLKKNYHSCDKTDNCSSFGRQSGRGCISGVTPYDGNRNDNYKYVIEWNCATPNSTTSSDGKYFYSSDTLKPRDAPTVYQNPNPTDQNYVTFKVVYDIDTQNPKIDEIITMLKVVQNNSMVSTTRSSNKDSTNSMVKSLCIDYPGIFLPTRLCNPNPQLCGYSSTGLDIACPSYSSVSGDISKPYPNFGGWYQYCSNPNTMSTPECNAFYQASGNVPDANVQNFLKKICTQLSGPDPTTGRIIWKGTGAILGVPVLTSRGGIRSIPVVQGGLYDLNNPPGVLIDPPTASGTQGQAKGRVSLNTNPKDPSTGYVVSISITDTGSGYKNPPTAIVVDTITTDQLQICGCFLPSSIYQDYLKKAVEDAGVNILGGTPPVCFFPQCMFASIKNMDSPNCSVIYQKCISNFSNTIIAGGNINNVSISNNSLLQCNAVINSTPVSAPAPASVSITSAPVAANDQIPPLLPNLQTITKRGPKQSSYTWIIVGIIVAIVLIGVTCLILKFVFRLF